ncbi:MAG: hypothetical protein HQK87_10690 [Nitrospinae bacterium]|nr:hypothetical protein [Nitrospinota bacterium]
MRKRIVPLLALLLAAPACVSLPDKLIWKNEETAGKTPQAEVKEEEVAPAGLTTAKVNPITPEEAQQTALARPKVVKVVDLRGGAASGKKYFDVVDQRKNETLAPVADQAARPVRVVTYDNNAIAKDYNLPFGSAWERGLEGLLELPLSMVDRSSGIVTTDWIYDENVGDTLLAFSPLGGGQKIRYKYTIRMMDTGDGTQIKVVPFAQALTTGGWRPAKSSLLVTERMFERIERELIVPVSSER